jgi:hypothetical protein
MHGRGRNAGRRRYLDVARRFGRRNIRRLAHPEPVLDGQKRPGERQSSRLSARCQNRAARAPLSAAGLLALIFCLPKFPAGGMRPWLAWGRL